MFCTASLCTANMLRYTKHPVLQNTLIRGMPSRQSTALFSSNGFIPMGGMGQQYKTRKGNTVRRRITVLNILPTSLQNEVMSQYGVSMSISTATPIQSRLHIIQRLTSQSNALTTLLSVFDVLTSDGQKNALIDCHELTTDVSIEQSALIGGAA